MARLSACFIVLLMSLLVAFLSLSVEAKVKHMHHGRPNFSDWVGTYHPELQKHAFTVHRKKTAKKVSAHLWLQPSAHAPSRHTPTVRKSSHSPLIETIDAVNDINRLATSMSTRQKEGEDKEPIPQPTRTKEMRDLYGTHHNTLGMWKGGLGQHLGN